MRGKTSPVFIAFDPKGRDLGVEWEVSNMGQSMAAHQFQSQKCCDRIVFGNLLFKWSSNYKLSEC